MTVTIREDGYYRDTKGNKIGPMRAGSYLCWQKGHGEGNDAEWSPEGEMKIPGPQDYGDLIAEWTDGPVRTVTRREVVPGVYDHVSVKLVHSRPNAVSVCLPVATLGPDALKAAAAVLLELAGALE